MAADTGPYAQYSSACRYRGGVSGELLATAAVFATLVAAAPAQPFPQGRTEDAHAAHAPVPAAADGIHRGPRQSATDADYYLRDASGHWAAPRCIGDGRAGPRVQPVFVHRKGRPSRYKHFRAVLQRSLRLTTGIVERSSRTQRTVRWVHDRRCRPVIWEVAVPAREMYNLDSLRGYLRARQPRFRKADRVYSLWVDGRTSPEWSGLGGNKWSATWSSSWGFVWVDAHELMHALGAIHPGAPHATGRGHCYDGYDVMCYSDGGHAWRKKTVCRSQTAMFRLDCGKDDYFSIDPRPGSWLARHPGANIANSRFLAAVAPRRLPRPPAPATDVRHTMTTVQWSSAPGVTYDVGMANPGEGLRWIARDVRGSSALLPPVTPGSRIYVRAVNDAGYAARVLSEPQL